MNQIYNKSAIGFIVRCAKKEAESKGWLSLMDHFQSVRLLFFGRRHTKKAYMYRANICC